MTADHDRMEEAVAAHALDACDDEERELVRAHLASCDTCQALYRRLTQVVDVIPAAADPVRAPRELRGRILAAAAMSPAGSWPEAEAASEGPGATPAPAPIVALPPRRAPRGVPRRWLQLGAVAVVVVGLAGLGAWNLALNLQLHQPPAQYHLAGTGTLEGATGTLTDYRGQGPPVASFANLPSPPPGRVYEVWLIDENGRANPAGVFTPDATGGATVQLDGSLQHARTVAVTQEAGPHGAQAPTQKPELAGQLGG